MIAHKNMWMVRAGEDSALADLFYSLNIAAIGWGEIPLDLTRIRTSESIVEAVENAYPGMDDKWKQRSAEQIKMFCLDMRQGDRVITFNRAKRYYQVGTVDTRLKFKKNIIESCNHYRRVSWEGYVRWDDLPVNVRATLKTNSALFPVPLDDQEGILRLLDSKKLIKQRLLNLDWKNIQDLVAGILRALGYKTRISSGGVDRGVDIFAGPDSLGIRSPRIYVTVKHRPNEITGAPQIRGFAGNRRDGDTCLFVSTGGFTREAYYEAEHGNIPLTLIDADDLVELLSDNYEKLDTETRALIPLVKVYWPV